MKKIKTVKFQKDGIIHFHLSDSFDISDKMTAHFILNEMLERLTRKYKRIISEINICGIWLYGSDYNEVTPYDKILDVLCRFDEESFVTDIRYDPIEGIFWLDC